MTGTRNSVFSSRVDLLPPALLGMAALILTACGSLEPPPVTYVLGKPTARVQDAEALVGRPVVEIKPVLVPDYLDVSEILIRHDEHVVTPSTTGRWGERLSVGVTRALAAGLRRRLPDLVITMAPPIEEPERQVLVEIETFEARADDGVALIARWHVLDGAGRETLAAERVSIRKPITNLGDAAVVAAMSDAVEALADRVTAGIQRTDPTADQNSR